MVSEGWDGAISEVQAGKLRHCTGGLPEAYVMSLFVLVKAYP